MKTTRKMLESICACINATHGLPNDLYVVDSEGVLVREKGTRCAVPNVGVVYLTGANGGWRIEQMSAGGGSSDFLQAGYESKRVVFLTASAYLRGYLEARHN